jgi:hypothetical protein
MIIPSLSLGNGDPLLYQMKDSTNHSVGGTADIFFEDLNPNQAAIAAAADDCFFEVSKQQK